MTPSNPPASPLVQIDMEITKQTVEQLDQKVASLLEDVASLAGDVKDILTLMKSGNFGGCCHNNGMNPVPPLKETDNGSNNWKHLPPNTMNLSSQQLKHLTETLDSDDTCVPGILKSSGGEGSVPMDRPSSAHLPIGSHVEFLQPEQTPPRKGHRKSLPYISTHSMDDGVTLKPVLRSSNSYGNVTVLHSSGDLSESQDKTSEETQDSWQSPGSSYGSPLTPRGGQNADTFSSHFTGNKGSTVRLRDFDEISGSSTRGDLGIDVGKDAEVMMATANTSFMTSTDL